MSKKQILFLILLLFSALLLRFWLSPTEGLRGDMNWWKKWSSSMVENGFTTVYEKAEANYPPLYLYGLGIVGHFYQKFISPSFEMNKAILNTLLKTPPIVFDILTGLAIFFALKKFFNFKIAYLSMLFYLFNPAIVYDSSVWGQNDALGTLFIILSLLCFIFPKKIPLGWFFLTLAIFIKFQSIIFFPLILFMTWKKDPEKPKQVIIGMIIAVISAFIILSPFLYTHKMDSFLNNMVALGSVGAYPVFSVNAFNIWWPAEVIKGQLIQDTNLIFTHINYRHLGLILFTGAYIFVLYFLNKKYDSKSIWLAASFVALAFFMLPTEMHERYLFPIFALLSMIWIQDKKLWPVYGILSVTFFLNLIYTLPLPFMSKASSIELGNASVAIVLINLGVFIYFIRLMIQQLRNSKCKLT